MAIFMNDIMNNELRGYAEFKAVRSAVVGKLYERSIVIRKFVLDVNDITREEKLTVKYGTIGMNPVAQAFGLDYNVVKNNVPVEVNLPEVDDKTECRRIKIDGHKYIQCTSLITIECDDDQKIEEFAAEGFVYEGVLYRALAASPSNEKKAVKFYYRVTDTEFDVEDSEVRMPMPFKDSTIDLKKMFYSKVVDNVTGEVNNLGANVLKDWPTYKEDNPVVEEEILDENSLYNTYKSLIAFRSEHPAIYKGTMSLVKDFTNGTIYKMNYNDETLYIAFNFGVNKTTLNNLSSSLDLEFSVNDAKVEGSNLVLPARGACVFKANEINLEFETTVETNSSGNTGSNVAPTEGYALLVTPGNGGSNYYVALTPVDEFEGFQQHMADDISLSVGDTFVLYDCTNQVSWVEDTLSQYGQYQKFSVTENGIRCNEDGIYDIYVKFKWEADEIYIGDMNGA